MTAWFLQGWPAAVVVVQVVMWGLYTAGAGEKSSGGGGMVGGADGRSWEGSSELLIFYFRYTDTAFEKSFQ